MKWTLAVAAIAFLGGMLIVNGTQDRYTTVNRPKRPSGEACDQCLAKKRRGDCVPIDRGQRK